jgi:hypothetical protein
LGVHTEFSSAYYIGILTDKLAVVHYHTTGIAYIFEILCEILFENVSLHESVDPHVWFTDNLIETSQTLHHTLIIVKSGCTN